MGLRILFGPKYWLWKFDESKLSFVTPYFLSHQMTKYAAKLYCQPNRSLLLWDMFGGIGTDSVYFSRYFNVLTTELDPKVFALLTQNVKSFNLTNVNIMQTNCISLLDSVRPDVIYYDPPWGESYKPKIKNFDFNQVLIDYPLDENFQQRLALLPKKVRSTDLVMYLYEQVSKKIIIKSPINSNTFERLFYGKITYIHKCPNKNLKFLFITE